MNYKIAIDIPNEEGLIDKIIDAASNAGAGSTYSHYSRVALIIPVKETWKTEEGAHPHIGEVGKISLEEGFRVEMTCSEEKIKDVVAAIRDIHPYEQPVIEILKLEEIDNF